MKYFSSDLLQFGRLLENYETNSPFVNDSVFTIMHHIAGS